MVIFGLIGRLGKRNKWNHGRRMAMARYDDVLNFSWPSVVTAVGVAMLAPVILPAGGYVVRPLAKGVIKAGLTIKDMTVGFVAETGEQISDMVAEAKAEHYAKPKA
jgi:hypothetical protein